MIKGVVPIEPDGVAVGAGHPAPDLAFAFPEGKVGSHTRLIQLGRPFCRKRSSPLDRHVLLQEGRLQLFAMPDPGRAQGCQVEALSAGIKINRLDPALALGSLARAQFYLLRSFRPRHDQHAVFAFFQSKKQVLRGEAEGIRRRIIGGAKYQVIAHKAGHDSVLDLAEQSDPLHPLRRFDLHDLRLAERENGRRLRGSLARKEDSQGHFVTRVAQEFAVMDLRGRSRGLERSQLQDFPAGLVAGRLGFGVDHHAPSSRPEHGGEAAVLDDGISLEGVIPAIISRVGSGFGRVSLQREKFPGHGPPARSIGDVDRVGEGRGGVPDDDIGGGFQWLDGGRAGRDGEQHKPRGSLPERLALPEIVIRLHKLCFSMNFPFVVPPSGGPFVVPALAGPVRVSARGTRSRLKAGLRTGRLKAGLQTRPPEGGTTSNVGCYSSSCTSWSTPRGTQTTSTFNSPQALCFTPRGT